MGSGTLMAPLNGRNNYWEPAFVDLVEPNLFR